MPTLDATSLATFIISLTGIVTGLLATFMIFTSMRKLGGKVGHAFWYIMWGVAFQTCAFSYTFAISVGYIPPLPDNLYKAVISGGLVLFVLGAKKFSELSR